MRNELGLVARLRRVKTLLRRPICAIGLAAMFTGLFAGPALAADPSAAKAPNTGFSTGVAVGPSSLSPTAGVPVAYIKLKQSQLAAFQAGTLSLQSLTRAAKVGSGSGTAAATTVTPMAVCASGFPCTWALIFSGFHQMTNYYCVVAFAQSVAYWDLSSSYKYWGGASSVRGAQDNLYNGPLKGGSTGRPGVVDTDALSWVNAQFSSRNFGFYYLRTLPLNSTGFMNMVRMDTYGYGEVNYVRVDLASYSYAWGQKPDRYGNHPLHATAATGYNDPAGTVTSYDPYSYGPGESSGPNSACSSTWFTTSYTWGCNWTLSQTNYYLAMDKGTSYPDEPMWY